MKKITSWGLRASIFIYSILHFITYFYENSFLLLILSISGLFLFLFAFFTFPFKRFKLPFFLFLIGSFILIFSGSPILEGFLNALLQMRQIIGLLVIVPIVSWVLREETYIEAIMSFAHKMLDTSRKMYFGMVSFTQIIAYFLMFGSIPVMYQFVNMILKNEKGEVWERFKGTAILRGFSLSVIWVVTIPSFIFVIEVMGASLWITILQGFGVAVFGVVAALIFSHFEEKRYGVDLTASLRSEIEEMLGHLVSKQQIKRLVIEFIILFISLFGAIFLLNAILGIELMLLIPLVIVVWTLSFYVVKKKIWKLVHNAKKHIHKDLIQESFQLSVMLGAGMVIYSLKQTDFAEIVINGINSLQSLLPFLNVLYLLPFMVIVLGFFGLGPLTVLVLVGGILANLNLPYPPELVVLAVTSGSTISILLSPMIMPLIVLSSANGLNGFKNGIQFNWKYALVIYFMVQLYVQLMVYFL
ncbi:hypothetical protein [Bacillus dakarensis]|uniref:hypothetical protein n=1 Tax=Robertmurraya dakarensis TaxID=1926278 RepID=UPI0009822972|nr:hypothetical protein [Bacillus dakarensis]